MKKNIVSLVLSEYVIDEIDRAAAQAHMNRSDMIDLILAGHLAYKTPEDRMREIFESVEMLFSQLQHFQFMLPPSDSVISLCSALSYKYNPTIRYSIELYKKSTNNDSAHIGELRISAQPQNPGLLLYMTQFFKLWAKIENAYVGSMDYLIEHGGYIRKLRLYRKADEALFSVAESKTDNKRLGNAIAAYIQAMDSAMKRFFRYIDDPKTSMTEVEREYTEYLRRQSDLLI